VERVKRAMGCWLATTTTESPSGDQSAGGADGGSSDRLRDALALHEVRVMKIYRPQLILEGSIAATTDRSRSFSRTEWSRLRHHGEGHFLGRD
jgi:hypothetical protein